MRRCTVLANFGGPRTLNEIEPFLKALLTDQDVIRTGLPPIIHRALFNRVAKKRSKIVAADYAKIGGASPIYADTEWLATELEERLEEPVFAYHRYLPATHEAFVNAMKGFDQLRMFPMFPQFTYATTGSIARWMGKYLDEKQVVRMRWIKSYPTHPAFIQVYVELVKETIKDLDDIVLLCSAHGTPKSFDESGDLYREECEQTYRALMAHFPHLKGILAYQSQFGKAEWLRPYTKDVCEEVEGKHIVFVPISFTSDHVETLFEIESLYMPIIRRRGMEAHRVPALNRRKAWVDAIVQILKEAERCNNQMLVRHN